MSIKTEEVMGARTQDQKNSLLEESILPVRNKQRPIGTLGLVWIWIGIAVMIASFQLGASAVAGVTMPYVVGIMFIANVVLAILMSLTADIGTEHGLSFAVYLRAPFGTLGTHLPAVFRGVVAAIWFGILTYLGALALNGIIEYLTGFSSWPLWYAVFACVQVANTALGIRAVEVLAAIAAPSIVAISIWMYYTLDVAASAQGLNLWTFAGEQDIGILTLFLANVAFWSTLAIDIPNITRFVKTKPGTANFISRNRHIFAAQFLALPVMQTWVGVIGAASFIAAGDWNPINVIIEQGTGLTLLAMLVLVVLAQWSTNNAANLIPAALTFVNAGAPRISYPMGVALAAVVGTLSMPWLILDHLFSFLFSYSAFLSSIGGIMVADYYFIRRRRINVPDLYNKDGQFRYVRGVNPAGIIAWVVSGGLAFYSGEYAFVVGLVGGSAIYFVLMTCWIARVYPQAEITSEFSNTYLGTTTGCDWAYDDVAGFRRAGIDEHSEADDVRQDL